MALPLQENATEKRGPLAIVHKKTCHADLIPQFNYPPIYFIAIFCFIILIFFLKTQMCWCISNFLVQIGDLVMDSEEEDKSSDG